LVGWNDRPPPQSGTAGNGYIRPGVVRRALLYFAAPGKLAKALADWAADSPFAFKLTRYQQTLAESGSKRVIHPHGKPITRLQAPAPQRRSLGLRCLVAIALCAAASGCVQRRLTIRSNPPGAVVYVDNYEIGTTPVATDYVYYGTRKIRLVKDGYETLTIMQPLPAPWFEFPGLDFFSENVNPREIRDERTLDFQLQPQVIVPTEQLLGRAENLRHSSQAPINPAAPAVINNSAPYGIPADGNPLPQSKAPSNNSTPRGLY